MSGVCYILLKDLFLSDVQIVALIVQPFDPLSLPSTEILIGLFPVGAITADSVESVCNAPSCCVGPFQPLQVLALKEKTFIYY